MPAGILIGIALNLQISLGSTAILTILSLLIHEHETFFDLLRSSLISFYFWIFEVLKIFRVKVLHFFFFFPPLILPFAKSKEVDISSSFWVWSEIIQQSNYNKQFIPFRFTVSSLLSFPRALEIHHRFEISLKMHEGKRIGSTVKWI